MSIFDTLVESGVTQEDLEKAASARLFAEAAAAEGIDLSELTEDQAEELYDFWANGGEEAEKAASAEDLLAEAAVKEAGAKLAEAEYIGRYMARVYVDEMDKIAKKEGPPGALRSMYEGAKDEGKSLGNRASSAAGEAYDKAHAGATRENLAARMSRAGAAIKGMTGYSDIKGGLADLKALRDPKMRKGLKAKDVAELRTAAHRQLGKGGLRAGLTAGALGGTGYLAHKAMSHKKESAFDTVVEQRAMEILEALQEPSFDEAVDEAALDLLRANGYDV